MSLSVRRFYARNTVVVPIPLQVASNFVERHHRQGMAHVSNAHCYGMYSQEDVSRSHLLGAIVFSPPRTKAKQREYRYELLRCCFAEGVRVVGGASKLIRHFITDVNPPDFFTYQDSSGELTDVYSHAGMVLVSEVKEKSVLVKDGLTYACARNNRRDWFSMQQVTTIGPDKLLGVNVGRVVDSSGRELTNVDIFTELLRYHVERVPGDRVFEWRNPLYWFYTYRLTATDSKKYYYGRRSVYVPDGRKPVDEDFVNDGYLGSGGRVFREWRNRHSETLVKEIMGVFTRWSDSVAHETKLIDSSYKDDVSCLNTAPATVGLVGANVKKERERQHCPTHGLVAHDSRGCVSCRLKGSFTQEECPHHGVVSHRNGKCVACASLSVVDVRYCPVHGESKHQAGQCVKCYTHMSTCPVHGETTHSKNGTCFVCAQMTKDNTFTNVMECHVHGETVFSGGQCLKCATNRVYEVGHCALHKETVFKSGACVACVNTRKHSIAHEGCEVHGENSLHVNGLCFLCLLSQDDSLGEMFNGAQKVEDSSKVLWRFSCQKCFRGGCSLTVPTFLDKVFQHVHDGALDPSWWNEFCSDCKSKAMFWLKDSSTQHVSRFIPNCESLDPPVVSKNDSRQVSFVCPDCGNVFSRSLRAVFRGLRQGKPVCPSC